MANIIKCRGFVLKTFPFKESSLIASVLTNRLGKIKLLAKGVRRPKSRICGAMEPFNLDEIIFHKREFKEIYNLSDAVVIDGFEKIREDPERVKAALVLCEFYEKTLPAEEADRQAYTLLLAFLEELRNIARSEIRLLVMSNLLKAFSGTGIMPHLDDCVICHRPISGNGRKVDFSVAAGGIVCSKHHDDTVTLLSPNTISAIKGIYTKGKLSVDSASLEEIENIISDYMYVHLGHLNLHSLKYLR